MRVAIIVSRITQVGPVKVIQALVNSLSLTEGVQIKVFYLDRKVDPLVKISATVERFVYNKFRFEDFDIIHTNGIRPDFFAFLKRKKIKYHISTIHNLVFVDLLYKYNKVISLIFGYLWLFAWRKADKLVCVSHEMKNYYKRWFSSSKLEVIYNGIAESPHPFTAETNIPDIINSYRSCGLKIIGSVAVISKIKGIDQLLRMVSHEKDFALVIIGHGKELKSLQQLARNLEITDRCLFCGFVNNALDYFKYFDLIALTSISEGFCLVLTEAVQQKVPVICSEIGVFRELFGPEEVTFYKLNDIKSLTAAVRQAIENGKDKIDSAYSRYKLSYTDVIMAKHYFELYRSAELGQFIENHSSDI